MSFPFNLFIALALFFAISWANGKETPNSLHLLELESILSRNPADFIKLQGIKKSIFLNSDSLPFKITSPSDTINSEILKMRLSIQQKIDSFKTKGQPTQKWRQKLDSLSTIQQSPKEKYNALLSYEQKLKDKLTDKIPGTDTLSAVGDALKEKAININEVSTSLGIGPLGGDLNPDITSPIPSGTLPELPENSISLPSAPQTELPSIPDTQLPDDLKIGTIDKNPQLSGLPDEVEEIQNSIDDITNAGKEMTEGIQEAEKYSEEIKTLQEEGLSKSEKLPELTEENLGRIEEVGAAQQEIARAKELEKYKELIEQYKEEKRIAEELKEKSKEIVNDLILQNQGKVDESLKKLGKYKRRFSNVHDIRNLSKRTPNPMKGLPWRERIIPGFTLQTLQGNNVWIELDPQIYVKLNGHWSAGAGGMYRFSMNPGKITFNDFNNLYGGKVFAHLNAFKGFFLRGEGQLVNWKPWNVTSSDPDYRDQTYIAAVGIGKGYSIAKKIQGNMQTLYHFNWGGMDPYKPKIMIRIGLDFSIKKREDKFWEKKLKEIKKAS